uniref:Peptidyl-prolyl cis-trans isomerase n=1 Tax=Eiseniibacteriota bacterium TaxID=2212470 RepID=A0A832I1M7_UNCEI
MLAAASLLCVPAAPIAQPAARGPVPAPPTARAARAAEPAAGTARNAARQPARSSGGPQAAVLETVLGTIVIRLAERDAPQTVANFKRLVASGFYDGTYFHRVIPGFMIQGGDPNTKNDNPNDDGLGGPGYTVPAEIGLPHVRGAVATARQADAINPKRASNASQFFIDVADQPSLDRDGYTVFGHVISGMDVVDRIVALAEDASLPPSPGGGRNPMKKTLVTRAWLEPLARWETPVPDAARATAR